MPSKRYQEEMIVFPTNVPYELIKVYKVVVREYSEQGGFLRKLARRIDVNYKYVHDLMKHGIEPTSRTKKGREAREKLFLKNDTALENKEEVIEALEQLVDNLQKTIRRLKE